MPNPDICKLCSVIKEQGCGTFSPPTYWLFNIAKCFNTMYNKKEEELLSANELSR